MIFDTKLDTSGASKEAKGLGSTLGKTFGAVASTGLKVFTAGVTAAVGGMSALGASAVKSYAEYEQLIGGVETLFKDSADIVSQYADNAYKTAGLSANQYMQTVTSFSASLLQSLDGDTEASAKAADQAITDMADNANKMGTSMEAIQNAYQGFAKQNYTMLDNLKLGYGGTKEEMERLLKDATAISGVEYDISNLSDVYGAIHVIQDELGITGTTAKEASTTISGSVASMKSAWTNLVTGMANGDRDITGLIENFVDSVGTVGENILPVVETVLVNIGELVEQLLPKVIDRIPALIEEVLPQLLESGINMVTTLLEGIQTNLPAIVEGALAIISQLITTFIELLPMLLEMGLQIIVQLALGIAEAIPELIPTIVQVMLQLVQVLIDNIPLLIDASIQLMTGLANGLIEALPYLVEQVPELVLQLVSALVDNAPKLVDASWEIIQTLAKALFEYLPQLLEQLPELMGNIRDKLIELVTNFYEIGSEIVSGIWNGLKDNWDSIVSWITDAAEDIIDSVKAFFGIASPSKKFKYLGEMCVAGFDEGIKDLGDTEEIQRNINTGFNTLSVGIGSSAGYNNQNNVNVTSHVYLEGEAGGVFRLVRQENNVFKKATGHSAFA